MSIWNIQIGIKTSLASELAGGIGHLQVLERSYRAFGKPLPGGHGSVESVRYRAVTARERSLILPVRRRAKSQKGASILEAVLFLPILFMLLWGMIDLARIGMVYYELHKMLYTIARYAGSSQNVNFCDDADPTVATAKNLALRASVDESAALILPTLTADLITVRAEKVDPDSQAVSECECSATGCDAATGGRGPDYIVVTIPDGYSVKTNIPFVASETFLLRPKVRVHFGGT